MITRELNNILRKKEEENVPKIVEEFEAEAFEEGLLVEATVGLRDGVALPEQDSWASWSSSLAVSMYVARHILVCLVSTTSNRHLSP